MLAVRRPAVLAPGTARSFSEASAARRASWTDNSSHHSVLQRREMSTEATTWPVGRRCARRGEIVLLAAARRRQLGVCVTSGRCEAARPEDRATARWMAAVRGVEGWQVFRSRSEVSALAASVPGRMPVHVSSLGWSSTYSQYATSSGARFDRWAAPTIPARCSRRCLLPFTRPPSSSPRTLYLTRAGSWTSAVARVGCCGRYDSAIGRPSLSVSTWPGECWPRPSRRPPPSSGSTTSTPAPNTYPSPTRCSTWCSPP